MVTSLLSTKLSTMDFFEKHKYPLSLSIITDELFKKLAENTFSILGGCKEVHNVSTLYNSKADVVKEVYAALLSITAEFVRQGVNIEEVQDNLKKVLSMNKTNFYCDLYRKSCKSIEISLLNVGNHLPHVTDVLWKIDYIVKTNLLDETQGPMFRISLSTEKYDFVEKRKKLQSVNFTCNSQELQDLVYKLKDVVRHCHKLTVDH